MKTTQKVLLCLFAGALSSALGLSSWAEDAQQTRKKNGVYIVRMAEKPVAVYDGDVPGYRATRPPKGTKLDHNNQDVKRYSAYLESRQDLEAARAGARKIYSYKYSFNGFAAKLTPDQVEALNAAPGILSIEEDEMRTVDTSTTPNFLGLDAAGVGLWNLDAGGGKKGNNMIVAIVDTGVWPEHPSFAKLPSGAGDGNGSGNYNFAPPGWSGKCVAGEQFTAANCNDKLIGARWYSAGWGGDAELKATLPWEFASPRDFNGHGSHTASTAAGNGDVVPLAPFSTFGKISGMAPYARLAVYKVCYTLADGTGSCMTSDSVAAIDQAVADGVDVINYSISGSSTSFLDSVEIAFMFAADAGVFVAASAGNSGPTARTVAHTGPWLTTVAAGTHNRAVQGSVTLGNGAKYNGASLASAVASAPLILSTAAGVAGADATLVRLCFRVGDAITGGTLATPVLDPAKVAGKIVVCDRGTNARVSKSGAVKDAGGIGMILLNTSANSLNADVHFVPTVHLQNTDRTAVRAYAATAGPTAAIAQYTVTLNAAAPFTASFSSRGPLRAGGGDLLKPDLIAPGQDILAAVAPPGNSGRLFDVYSGTSMSSPHVAGLAALVKNLHPEWSPMMVKSALMTTGYDVLDGPNTNPTVIFSQGAGHVSPNKATDPGLVFDSNLTDWLGFLCGTQLSATFCTTRGIPVLDASNLNLASIAIGDLAGRQTVTRAATNVGAPSTYRASVTGLAGLDVVVSPATFTLNAGASQPLQVSITRNGAAVDAYVGGYVTWSDGKHNVRVPVVVKPVALAAPAQVSQSYTVKFGYTGAFKASARGLVDALVSNGSVVSAHGADFDPGATDGTVKMFLIDVPAGTTVARFSTFDATTTPGSDLDLYVFDPAGNFLASSGGATAQEEVTLSSPGAGTYHVFVHGYAAPASGSTFKLFSWTVGSTDAGNMGLSAPTSAVLGTSGTITLAPVGLLAGHKYMGAVAYTMGVGGAPVGTPTIVRIDP
jgi:subtilisin family serine protease